MPATLTRPETLAVLAEGPSRLAALTEGIAPPLLRARPQPEEWSANEILAHLRSCADVWGGCIATIVGAVIAVLAVGAVVASRVHADGVAIPGATPTTIGPLTGDQFVSPQPIVSPLPYRTQAVAPLVGTAGQPADARVQTVALRGSPFSFHADGEWLCADANRGIDVNAFVCVKGPSQADTAFVHFAVWLCPGPCTGADRTRTGAAVRTSTPPFVARNPTLSVAEQTVDGTYHLDVDLVFAVGQENWVLELQAAGPGPDTAELQKLTNNIYGQTR
jgi:hypothetical protein